MVARFLFSVAALAASTGLAMPGSAQEADCRAASVPLNETDGFDRSFGGGYLDGGLGTDTFALQGPGHLALRPTRFNSFERIDLRNGLFDTVLIDAGFIGSAEDGQVEFVTDPFDQIFADPHADWHRRASDAPGGQVFSTSRNGVELSFRTDLDAHVVLPSPPPLLAVEGAEGPFRLIGQAGTAGPPALLEARLSWAEPGVVLPDLAMIVPGALTLDTRNGRHNVIGLDLGLLGVGVPRDLRLQADATDRVVLLQPDCWTMAPGDRPDLTVARHEPPSGAAVTVTADAELLRPFRTGPVITAVAATPGFRHLDTDLSSAADEIDLRNDGRDVVILRNAALRHDVPVVIAGDAGLDEVWIEGSAGWKIDHGGFGITVSTPGSSDGRMTVALGPGLGLRLLPAPPFLTDPAMATAPFYPGTRDEASDGQGMFFTRGGIVRLSPTQLQGRQRLMFRNGIANAVHLDFSRPLNGEDRVVLSGDGDRDHLVVSGGQRHEAGQDGALVWRLPRDGGGTQEVRATGFAYVAYLD